MKSRGKKGQQEARELYLKDMDFKEMVIGVLESAGLARERPAKMNCDDFLKLLSAFNKQGIHFK